MASWLEWLYGNVTPGSGSAPQTSYDALGNPLPGAEAAPIGLPNNPMAGAPFPPQRPTGIGVSGLPVPMAPQRPTGINLSGNGVPLPPQRPAGIVPQAPGLGAPAISYDPLGNAIPGSNDLPVRQMNVPLPPQRPTNLMASMQTPQIQPVQRPVQRQAPANLPAPGATPAQASTGGQSPAQGQGQNFEWVKTKDEMGRDVWTTRPIGSAPAQNPVAGPGQGLQAFMQGLNPSQGSTPVVGATGPQIPQPTGLAAMLGAQPSMQAQNSTGPTAFLDQLFGFRG